MTKFSLGDWKCVRNADVLHVKPVAVLSRMVFAPAVENRRTNAPAQRKNRIPGISLIGHGWNVRVPRPAVETENGSKWHHDRDDKCDVLYGWPSNLDVNDKDAAIVRILEWEGVMPSWKWKDDPCRNRLGCLSRVKTADFFREALFCIRVIWHSSDYFSLDTLRHYLFTHPHIIC